VTHLNGDSSTTDFRYYGRLTIWETVRLAVRPDLGLSIRNAEYPLVCGVNGTDS
jgi:hypothetical protein